MTEKQEKAWYKRFMAKKSINPQPKAVREALHMVTPTNPRITRTGDKLFYCTAFFANHYNVSINGSEKTECYSSLANYWHERLTP